MQTMKYLVATLSAALTISGAREAAGITFQTLDYPMSASTSIRAVQGNNVVGGYWDGSSIVNGEHVTHGFLYNGSTFTTFDHPLGYMTSATGIFGNTIVGTYKTYDNIYHGFVYDGTTWTTLDHPSGAKNTHVFGISGKLIVGNYDSGANPVAGFIYDGSSWTPFDYPNQDPSYTAPHGIQGSTVVGYYYGHHGFIYDGSIFTTVDYPSASRTQFFGISGTNSVGYWTDGDGMVHGFLYDGTSFTPIEHPLGAKGTWPQGIDGNTVVGYYRDSANVFHGFIATIPEPSSIALLVAGAIGVGMVTKRRRRSRTTVEARIQ